MEHNRYGGPINLSESFIQFLEDKRIVCLVDGEHYPPVTKWALSEIEETAEEIPAIVLLGGTEKVENPIEALSEGFDYRIFSGGSESNISLEEISRAIDYADPDLVLDLSDEPIVDYHSRFEIASSVLGKGVIYMGSDFVFSPPTQADVLEKPSISIIGTGKRVGKTAVGVMVSRILKDEPGFDPVVVCMGRGGPSEPDYLDFSESDITAESLLEFSEEGGHAASDYWEDALLGQVPTLGCRRCGGGMAGNPFVSNVLDGAGFLNKLNRDFFILEGSGATFPPVRTDARIVVIGAGQPMEKITDFFGRYRVRTSDLAVVTMCEEPVASKAKREEIAERLSELNPEMKSALTVFRPEPIKDVSGSDVFVCTTSEDEMLDSIVEKLEEEHKCNVCGISNNLSDQEKLRLDLEGGLEGCEVLLTEIKASSVSVAVKMAMENDLGVVFLHNKPKLIGGTVEDLEEEVISLCEKARGR